MHQKRSLAGLIDTEAFARSAEECAFRVFDLFPTSESHRRRSTASTNRFWLHASPTPSLSQGICQVMSPSFVREKVGAPGGGGRGRKRAARQNSKPASAPLLLYKSLLSFSFPSFLLADLQTKRSLPLNLVPQEVAGADVYGVGLLHHLRADGSLAGGRPAHDEDHAEGRQELPPQDLIGRRGGMYACMYPYTDRDKMWKSGWVRVVWFDGDRWGK